MERPNVSCGDVNVEMVFKRAYDVHDIEGIESKILNEVGVISKSALICNAINGFLNKFKKLFFHLIFSLLRLIFTDQALWLRSGGA